ncbi:uncharacterized protein LOC122636177 [Vespula pensylvanica]|uniref:uncharacterized protein LOC122636177 n=1 Tax=Vespula pensylvanica TaxID=30213 RepID=UPI001CBA0729|nr:uncharacterized protein LOC122636177 [Vespula pensylvanica]
MDDDIASLNYDCNYNLYLAKRLVIDMKRFRGIPCHRFTENLSPYLTLDRQNAVKWLRFLMKTNHDIAAMRLRNDFMHYLVLNLQESQLRPPFDKPPPSIECLMDIAKLIVSPGKTEVSDDGVDSMTKLEDLIEEKSMIMSLSPDDGAFLASQPVPHHGSFCYLAITTKKKES